MGIQTEEVDNLSPATTDFSQKRRLKVHAPVLISVGNKVRKIPALIDTGNSVQAPAVVSLELAKDLGMKVKPLPGRSIGTAKKKTALNLIGEAENVELKIEGLRETFRIPALVVESLSQPLNLGAYFLSEFNLSLQFNKKEGAKLSNKRGEWTELIQQLTVNSTENTSGQYCYDVKADFLYASQMFDPIFDEKPEKVEIFCNAKQSIEQQDVENDAIVKSNDDSIELGSGQTPVDDRFEVSKGATLGGNSSSKAVGGGAVQVLQEGPSVSLTLSESVTLPNQAINVLRVNIPSTKDEKVLIQCLNSGKEEVEAISQMTHILPGIYEVKEDGAQQFVEVFLVNQVDGTDFHKDTGEKVQQLFVKLPAGKVLGVASRLTHKAIFEIPPEKVCEMRGGEVEKSNEGTKVQDKEGGNEAFEKLLRDLKIHENPMLKTNNKAKGRLVRILRRYQKCFFTSGATDEEKYGLTDVTEMKIRLKPGAVPIRQKVRPLNPKQEEVLEKQLKSWQENGIIEPSRSEWASPCVIVSKKTGDWRVCIDYRRLNDVTLGDSYPLPRIETLLSKAGGHRIYSAIDASNAYHCIPMEEASKSLTAFVCPAGLFQFRRMPFGLKGAPGCYSRFIDTALSQLGTNNLNVYLDDILIYNNDMGRHLDRLEEVLEVHKQSGIKINAKKTVLFVERVPYLGHMLSVKGVEMIPEYIKRVEEWPVPTTVKQLNTFLGFLCYYRHFIKDFSLLTCEMMEQKKRKTLTWTPEMTTKMNQLKDKFRSAPIRAVPDFKTSEKFILTTDYSGKAISAILSQVQDGQERLISVGGRKATEPETRYASWKGELSALIHGLRKFENILKYKPFLVVTDSSCLRHLNSMKRPSGIAGRWLDEIQAYEFQVVHRPGKLNTNADNLSRADHLPEPDPEDEEEQREYVQAMTRHDLTEAQREDPVLQEVAAWLRKGEPPDREAMRGQVEELHRYRAIFGTLKRLEDGLLVYCQAINDYEEREVTRVLVPEAARQEVFHLSHSHQTAGHFGITATLQRAKKKFYWPGMSLYLKSKVQTCANCLMKQTKVNHRTGPHVPRHNSYPGEVIYVDLIGPYPETTEGYRYCLTIEDGFTRFCHIIPLRSKETIEVTKELINKYVSVWSCPHSIISDNGKEFTSAIFQTMMKELQIVRRNLPAYNPWSNKVERFHRTVHAALRTVLDRDDKSWIGYLPALVLAYNSKVHASTGVSPYLATFGREANLPVDLILELPAGDRRTVQEQVSNSLQRFKRIYKYMLRNEQAVIQRNSTNYSTDRAKCKEGDVVWYLTPRLVPGKPQKHTQGWTGPWTVTKVVAPVLVRIRPKNNEGKEITVHFSRLRDYHGPTENTVPRRLGLTDEDEDEDNDEIALHRVKPRPEVGVPVYIPVPDAGAQIQDKAEAFKDQVAEEPGQPPPAVPQEVQDEIMEEPPEPPVTTEATEMEELNKPEKQVRMEEDRSTSEDEAMVPKPRGIIRRRNEVSETANDSGPDRPTRTGRTRRVRAKVAKLLSPTSSSEEIDAISIPTGVGSSMPHVSKAGIIQIGVASDTLFPPNAWQQIDINLTLGLASGQAAQLTANHELSKRGILTPGALITSEDTQRIKVWFLNTKDKEIEVKAGTVLLQGIVLSNEDDVKFCETANLRY